MFDASLIPGILEQALAATLLHSYTFPCRAPASEPWWLQCCENAVAPPACSGLSGCSLENISSFH